MQKKVVLLHNIRSAHNVGSIFRTADGAGVSEIILSGYSPCPGDTGSRANRDIAKTALGAEQTLSWKYVKTPLATIRRLKKEGMRVVGVEQDESSVDYRTYKDDASTAFLFGNEVRGLSQALRRECDVLLEIPMHGKKESLNVSVTAGIILFGVAST